MKLRPEHEQGARMLVALLRNESGICRVKASSVREYAYPAGTKARAQADHTVAMWKRVERQLRDIAAELESDISE